MDKTVEIVVVAMVALVTGLAVLYLATGQAEGFGGFADDRQQSAQCEYWKQTCEPGEQKPDFCGESAPSTCPSDDSEDSESQDAGSQDSGSSEDVDCSDPKNSGLPVCN